MTVATGMHNLASPGGNGNEKTAQLQESTPHSARIARIPPLVPAGKRTLNSSKRLEFLAKEMNGASLSKSTSATDCHNDSALTGRLIGCLVLIFWLVGAKLGRKMFRGVTFVPGTLQPTPMF